jgi:REP-associated tyrosine transposase
MGQSLSNILIHAVFSTKERRPFLADVVFRDELHAMLGGASSTLECTPVIVGGVADHLHVLANLSRTISPADWIKEIKRVTSVWAKQHQPLFGWQNGYGAFSVSQSMCTRVTEYIRDQESHHRKMDFQSELRELLRRNGVSFDEQYVWD